MYRLNQKKEVFYKKAVPKNLAKFTEKHLARVSFFPCNLIKIETLAQVLSREFCDTFFYDSKPGISNVQIKPHNSISPDITMELLKRVFITLTDNLFKKYLHEEMEVLVNLFTKNGQNRKELEKVTLKYIDKIILSKKSKI